MSSARRELDLIGMTSNNKDAMNREMRRDVLEILDKFSKQGHSGLSASYAIDILNKLLKQEPLSPLKGTKNEWNFIWKDKKTGKKLYQNNRCSHVFKEVYENGKEYIYDSEGIVFKDKKHNDATYTSKDSRVPVTFPYTPKTVYKRR